MDMLEEAVKYIMLGFLYKFILAHILGETLLPPLKDVYKRQGEEMQLSENNLLTTIGYGINGKVYYALEGSKMCIRDRIT